MNKITFIGINLILSSGILMWAIFAFIYWLFFADINSTWWKYIPKDSPWDIFVIIGIPLVIFALYWLFKIFLFFVIDKFSKEDSYSYKVFYNMKTDENFRTKAIIYAFVFDMFFLVIWALYLMREEKFYTYRDIIFSYLTNFGIMLGYWLLFGMGVFICYLSYALWIKRKEFKAKQ